MLVLRQYENQSVVLLVGDLRIVIKTIEIRGQHGHGRGPYSRLGFEAPPEVTIHREEVQLRIDREGAA